MQEVLEIIQKVEEMWQEFNGRIRDMVSGLVRCFEKIEKCSMKKCVK